MRKLVLLVCLVAFCFSDNFEEGVKEYIRSGLDGSIEFFKKSCDIDNNAAGCFLAGFGMENSGDIKGLAMPLYQKACNMGDMNGCDAVGQIYAGIKTGEDADMQKAMPYLQKACDANLASSCIALGEYYSDGLGNDILKAKGYFKNGCDSKDGLSCFYYANLYDTKKLSGLSQDEIMEYYGLGCDYGDDMSCQKFRIKYKVLKK